MATTAVDIVVKVAGSSRLDKLNSTLKGTASQAVATGGKLDRLGNSAKKAGNDAARSVGGFNKLNGAINALGRSLAGLAIGDQLRRAFGASAELSGTEQRIKNVTQQYQQFIGIQQSAAKAAETFSVSNQQALSDFSDLASRLGSTGATLKDLENIYAGFNTLLIENAVGSQQAAAAQLQLNQALGAGRLNGEEFNSIAESTPQLLDEIARVTGVARGELKQFAADGGITSQILIQALTNIRTQGADRLAAALDTPAGKLREFNKAISEFQVAVGNELLPVITPLIVETTKLLQAFGELPGPVKTAAVGLTAVGAAALALGPLLSAAVAGAKLLGGALLALGGGAGTAAGALSLTTKALLVLKGALIALPWVAAAAGLTALTVATVNYYQEKAKLNKLLDASNTMTDDLTGAQSELKSKISDTSTALANASNKLEKMKESGISNARAIQAQSKRVRELQTLLDNLEGEYQVVIKILEIREKFGIDPTEGGAGTRGRQGGINKRRAEKEAKRLAALQGASDSKKEKTAKGRIQKLSDFTSKNDAQLAENKIRLDRQVFENALQLEELKFKKQQEFAQQLQDVQEAGLNAGARSVFNNIREFSRGVNQIDSEIRELQQQIARAERDVEDARAGRAVESLRAAPTSFTAPGSTQVGNANVQAVLEAAEKNIGLMAGSSERCADAMRELFKVTGIGIGVTKEAWDGLASGGRLASSFFGSDIGEKITNIRDLRPGDLVGFEQTYGSWGKGVQTHVGIYAGDGMMYDHSSSKGLTKRSMEGTFPGKFLYGVRPDAYGQQAGQGIMPGGQADMSNMLSQEGQIELAEEKLKGLNAQEELLLDIREKSAALKFEQALAKQAQLFGDQTSAIERQTEALQLKGRLEAEGVSSEKIEGELKKLEVMNTLTDTQDAYTAALEAGLITEQQYQALRGAAAASATEQASAIDQLTAAQERYNEQAALQSQLQGLASGIASEFTSAFKSIIDGTKDVNEAFADMLQGIADQFLNMAMKILQDALTQQLVKLFTGLFSAGAGAAVPAGGGIGGGAFNIGLGSFDGGGYTGDGPRSGGIDGKGGFPALLHPQETVVDHYQEAQSAMVEPSKAFADSSEAMEMAMATRNNNTASAAEASAMQTAESYFASGKSTVKFDTYRVGEMDVVTREDAIRIGQQSAKQAEANVYKGLRNMPSVRSRSGVK